MRWEKRILGCLIYVFSFKSKSGEKIYEKQILVGVYFVSRILINYGKLGCSVSPSLRTEIFSQVNRRIFNVKIDVYFPHSRPPHAHITLNYFLCFLCISH